MEEGRSEMTGSLITACFSSDKKQDDQKWSDHNCNQSYVEAGVCFWKIHVKWNQPAIFERILKPNLSLNDHPKMRWFNELYGDDSQWVTPVPISNTEVKPLNADDSVKAKIGSRQTNAKPWRIKEKSNILRGFFFMCWFWEEYDQKKNWHSVTKFYRKIGAL